MRPWRAAAFIAAIGFALCGPVSMHYPADYNIGAENTLHSGPDTPSHLLLPVIPPK